jgi:hypothetical protein
LMGGVCPLQDSWPPNVPPTLVHPTASSS